MPRIKQIEVSSKTGEALCMAYINLYDGMALMKADGVELEDIASKAKKIAELCIKDFVKESSES